MTDLKHRKEKQVPKMQSFTYPYGKANERRSYMRLQRYLIRTQKLNGAPLWSRKAG